MTTTRAVGPPYDDLNVANEPALWHTNNDDDALPPSSQSWLQSPRDRQRDPPPYSSINDGQVEEMPTHDDNNDEDPFHRLLNKNVSILDQLIQVTSTADPTIVPSFMGDDDDDDEDGDDNHGAFSSGHHHHNPFPPPPHAPLARTDDGTFQILQPNAAGRLSLRLSSVGSTSSSDSAPLESNQVRVSLNGANLAVIRTPSGKTLQVQFDPDQIVTADAIHQLLEQIAVDP